MKVLSDENLLQLLAISIEGRTGYRWVPELTRHGTGSIVLVFDTQGFPKYVAFKTITLANLEDQGKLEVFLREIKRTLRAQGHPLIARVTGVIVVGVPRGDYYAKFPVIVMRYYEQNLREYTLDKGVLGVDEALFIAIQVVKGLLYLREKGFLAHQDLKPENIFVKDISEEFFVDDIPPIARIRAVVADFGLADAMIEAGIPGGTNPYKAPEQFLEKDKSPFKEELIKAGLFNPDVFALGVILTEMLTGKHPCGLSSREVIKPKVAEATEFWENWSIRGDRIVDVENVELRNLILRMLEPNPQKRPSLDEIYVELTRILKNVNAQLYNILETQLSFYDDIARSYKDTLDDITIRLQLLKLSVLPESSELIKELADSVEDMLKKVTPPKSPEEVYEFIILAHALGKILLHLDREYYKEKIIALATESLDIISNWRNQIKAIHIPYLPKNLSIADYEAHAELIKYPLDLLKAIMHEEEVEELINRRYDAYIRSHYLFNKACDLHGKDNKLAIEYLEKVLEYSPGNETILYLKALWKYQQALIEKDLAQKCKLLKESIEELENLIRSRTKLKEVERTLEEVKAEFSRFCTSTT
ncbi:MAG: protein kinase [Thermofilum sp.]|nr:protein kinase [Thermofilum sp.]